MARFAGRSHRLQRLAGVVVALLVLGAMSFAALAWWGAQSEAARGPAPSGGLARAITALRPRRSAAPQAGCDGPAALVADAARNAETVDAAAWSPSGRPETGWRVYAPLIARELGTACPPESPGFALALSRWRSAHAQGATGSLDEPTLKSLVVQWLMRRPFVRASRGGQCPASPPPEALAAARPDEGYQGKPAQALAPALKAYRRMRAAAGAELAAVRDDPALLSIFSAYRGPQEEAARCAGGGCDGLSRSRCSAHRTGTAFDLYLGPTPGFAPGAADDANRAQLARTPAYLWLVANADRFGFAPYPFEPWHWEWTGAPEAPASGVSSAR